MKILVVIDAQNDFIDGALGSREAQEATPRIAERIARNDFDLLVFTQDTHSENYMNTREGAKLPVPHCIRGSEGWKISPILLEAAAGLPKDKVKFIVKPTFGSFELKNLIEEHWDGGKSASGPLELEFCGFCTDICVVSNVLICKAAFYADASVKVNAACCAGVTPGKHEAALETMSSCQIDII